MRTTKCFCHGQQTHDRSTPRPALTHERPAHTNERLTLTLFCSCSPRLRSTTAVAIAITQTVTANNRHHRTTATAEPAIANRDTARTRQRLTNTRPLPATANAVPLAVARARWPRPARHGQPPRVHAHGQRFPGHNTPAPPATQHATRTAPGQRVTAEP